MRPSARRHVVPLSRPRTTAPDVVCSFSSLPLAPSIHRLQDRSHSTTRHERRLAEAVVLVPKGVVCLTSALQYHEIDIANAIGRMDGN